MSFLAMAAGARGLGTETFQWCFTRCCDVLPTRGGGGAAVCGCFRNADPQLDEKISTAEKLKEEGNAAFKEGRMQDAMGKYHSVRATTTRRRQHGGN